MRFKQLKLNSIESLKRNYVLTIIMCLIGLIFLSLHRISSGSLANGIECFQNYFDNGHFATNATVYYLNSDIDNLDFAEVSKLTDEELKAKGYINSAINYMRAITPDIIADSNLVERFKIRDGIIKPILLYTGNNYNIVFDNIDIISLNFIGDNVARSSAILAIGGLLFWVIYYLFISNVLLVGYYRFFLENTKYRKTRIRRIYYGFHKNYLNVFRAMLKKDILLLLWYFTIIGGIIKSYSYRLVPYLLAEDRFISSKDVIKLSNQLMKGYKFKAFLLDCSFLGWDILNILSLGICGVFFLDAYKEGTYAEFYKTILNEKKDDEFVKTLLNGREYFDKDLYIEDTKDYYPGTERPAATIAMQDYKPLTLVFLFFIFSFFGWCLEVVLFLLLTHSFINRGTLTGPWLPIYGMGCVTILVVFTKTKLSKYLNNPMVLFLLIALICGIIEYSSSYFVELTTGLRYWDYVGHFLNINGRVCFEGLCEFGLGGLISIHIVGPRLNKYISAMKTKTVVITVAILTILFSADFMYSKANPRIGYGITGALIDKNGNPIENKKE